MRNCKKIIVTRKAKLVIDSSCISGCNWQGIEVWGWWDACPADSTEQGLLYANNLTLSGANIGIYVGKRDTFYPNPEYAGGIIKINHSHFKNNYVDIMFSPWTFDVVCQCSWQPDGQKWWSEIQNSYFDTLSSVAICDAWVDNIINLIDSTGNCYCPYYNYNYFMYIYAINLIRCHVIDLSPYVDIIFIYYHGALLCPSSYLTCYKYAGEDSHYFPATGSVLNNNVFIDGCRSIPPAIFYYH